VKGSVSSPLVGSPHSSSSVEALSKFFRVRQSLLALVRPSMEALPKFCKFHQSRH
jgi:hypothetical protein